MPGCAHNRELTATSATAPEEAMGMQDQIIDAVMDRAIPADAVRSGSHLPAGAESEGSVKRGAERKSGGRFVRSRYFATHLPR
jgi:hypothetical protein